MEFDKNKVLTCVTADQAKVGDIGWFGDDLEGLQESVKNDAPGILEVIKGHSAPMRFGRDDCVWALFYPAPYEFLQAKWVKENRLKVGDSVYINKGWKKGEKGFDSKYDCDIPICQSYWLTRIYDDCMVVATKHKTPVDNNHDITKFDWFYRNTAEYFVPYFAIEKVAGPEYRPFASAEEFMPYRDKWLIDKHDSDIVRVELYCNSGITEVRGYCSYDELLNSYTFDDGTPAGVKV